MVCAKFASQHPLLILSEYADLDPATAAALVISAKQSQSQTVQPPAYGLLPAAQSTYPGFAPQLNQYPPASTNNAPNLSSMISSLDSNSLSQLLGAMSQNTSAQTPQPLSAGPTPDLARLFGSISSPAQSSAYTAGQQAPPQTYQQAFQKPSLASMLGGQPSAYAAATPSAQAPAQTSSHSQPDMNEIMAQLAKYQR